MTAPRVSVVLPVRDAMPYLPEALDSLRAQTFEDFEVLVQDDGSTDGTAEALASVPGLRSWPFSTRSLK